MKKAAHGWRARRGRVPPLESSSSWGQRGSGRALRRRVPRAAATTASWMARQPPLPPPPSSAQARKPVGAPAGGRGAARPRSGAPRRGRVVRRMAEPTRCARSQHLPIHAAPQPLPRQRGREEGFAAAAAPKWRWWREAAAQRHADSGKLARCTAGAVCGAALASAGVWQVHAQPPPATHLVDQLLCLGLHRHGDGGGREWVKREEGVRRAGGAAGAARRGSPRGTCAVPSRT
jgi:hypothetical protein